MPVAGQPLVIQSKFGLMFFSQQSYQLLVDTSGKLAIYQIPSLICLIFSFIAKMLTCQQVSIWMRAHLERELAQVKAWLNWHVGFQSGYGPLVYQNLRPRCVAEGIEQMQLPRKAGKAPMNF